MFGQYKCIYLEKSFVKTKINIEKQGIMYQLQQARMFRDNGKPIKAEKLKYENTIFIFDDYTDAEQTRLSILSQETGIGAHYIRIIEV